MRILALSTDEELSRLRKFALTAAGHNVTPLSTEKEALAACKGDAPYDVVLLCHKLTSAAARVMVRLLRENKPQARIIYIVHLYGEWPEVEADRYVVGSDGPEALVRVLEEVKANAV